MVRAGDRGVHADQRHVRLSTAGGLGDHRLHQHGEHAAVTPLGEAVVDRLPGPELLGHLPPLAAAAELPNDALELFTQMLRIRAIPADGQEWLDQLPLTVVQFASRHGSFLPAPPGPRWANRAIDHDSKQAL